MKQSKLCLLRIILFVVAIIISSNKIHAQTCPVKVTQQADSVVLLETQTGIKFKLEPKASASGWVKIQQADPLQLSDSPWSWVPMNVKGRLQSYVRHKGQGTMLAAELFVEPDAYKTNNVDILIKKYPYNAEDQNWYLVSYTDSKLTCKNFKARISKPADQTQVQEVVRKIEVNAPGLVYGMLGL